MSWGPAQRIREDGIDAPGSGPTIAVDSSTPRLTLGASDPEQIAAYRILGRIGEGGMATVYKAEQRDPVRRIVALKVIKLGMDSKQVVARFEAERQALALMNHPNVAKVFEAGMTDGGRPYFAMEFVPGVPITRYCDDSHLTIHQRIELFIPVCQAVQHAHQKGIIHRDLKPGNILVQLFEGEPVPKVIDFGIAKATNQSLTQHTLHTEVGSMLGTPEYMSPEQAQTSGLDVDTRTDIYSLGVILYQLLTGTLPFDPRELRSGGPEGIVRTLRESEPPRPSTRVGSLSGQASDPVACEDPRTRLARTHGADPHALLRELRGDLDWIVLKAMEKDRSRRYATANALAVDLQRYLDEDPVAARPPTTWYRVQKFTRRHRTGVLVTASTFVALVLSLAAVTGALVRANHEQRIAEDRTRDAQDEKKQADEATGQVRQVSQFLEQWLSDLLAVSGRDLTPQQALDRLAAHFETAGQGSNPATELGVRRTLARLYSRIGCYRRAATQLRSAVSLIRAASPQDKATLVVCLDELAEAQVCDGQMDEAERALLEAEAQLGTRQPEPPAMARTLELRGIVMADRGQWLSAESDYGRAWQIFQNSAQAGSDSGRLRLLRADLKVCLNPQDLAAALDLDQAVNSFQRSADVATPQVMVGPLRILARSAARRQDWTRSQHLLQMAIATHCNDWGLFDQMLQTQGVLLSTHPEDLDIRQSHMSLAARTGEFAAADADAVALIERQPERSELWQLHLMLLLRLGDLDRYGRTRADALGRFSGSREADVLHRIAKSSLAGSPGGPETELAAAMADKAEGQKSQPFYHQTKGMAEYRRGNYRAAISWFEKCRGLGVLYLDVASDFYLAMAWMAAGDRERAIQFWNEGTALWDQQAPKLGDDDLVHADDWILCELARQQARAILYPKAPRTQPHLPAG